MKTIIAKIAVLLSCVAFCASCQKNAMPEAADTTTLTVALTPAPGNISAAGASFDAAVVVNQGVKANVPWTLTVDANPEWISFEKIKVEGQFTGTYEGDDRTTSHDGIRVTVQANASGAVRTAYLRFATADGSSVVYTLTQKK